MWKKNVIYVPAQQCACVYFSFPVLYVFLSMSFCTTQVIAHRLQIIVFTGIVFNRDVRGQNARGTMSCENRIVIIVVNAFLMSIGGRVINALRTFSIAFSRLSIPVRAYSYDNRKCNTSSRCHERARPATMMTSQKRRRRPSQWPTYASVFR